MPVSTILMHYWSVKLNWFEEEENEEVAKPTPSPTKTSRQKKKSKDTIREELNLCWQKGIRD